MDSVLFPVIILYFWNGIYQLHYENALYLIRRHTRLFWVHVKITWLRAAYWLYEQAIHEPGDPWKMKVVNET